MKKNYFSRVLKVINASEIIIEVLDARFPELSRNEKIEKIIKQKGKKLLIVLNKSDLVKNDLHVLKKSFNYPTVFLSAKEKKGIIKLREAIGKLSKKKNVIIGIIGYPNTGKSSIINSLKGTASASVSSVAGHTRGEQFVKVSEKILLIDTPGVLEGKTDENLLVLIGAINPEKLEDAESSAYELIEYLLGQDENFFQKQGVKTKNSEEILEELALKRNKLLKGGKADTQTMAVILLRDWQKGKLLIK